MAAKVRSCRLKSSDLPYIGVSRGSCTLQGFGKRLLGRPGGYKSVLATVNIELKKSQEFVRTQADLFQQPPNLASYTLEESDPIELKTTFRDVPAWRQHRPNAC